MRKAFSYARFSHPGQADGYSLDRQLEAAKAYCKRNGLTLDERSFLDEGWSGYYGGNVNAGDLSVFIELVKDGRIPKGSVLIVENTDRLSRLPPDEANRIITTIVKAGIDIVTTSPEQVYTAANINKLSTWIPLQVSNCLAREESEKKSDRLKDAWGRKRGELADNKKMSKKGPAWLRLSADRTEWVVIEDKAKWVRQAFRWAAEGMGVVKICERLHRECPEGLTGRGWQPSYVNVLLRSRSVLGEYQPHAGTCAKKGGVKSTRRPVGEPVKGYFPAIVSEAEFYKVQDAISARRKGGGRVTGTPNLFNGFLWCAADGGKMVMNATRGKRTLVPAGAVRKLPGSTWRQVGYKEFEAAVLSLFRELKPADVVGKARPGEDQVEALSGRLAALNHNIAKTQQRAAKADDPTVFLDLLEDLGRQRKEVIEQLERAKAEAASQAGDTLGECASLITLLREAEEDEREDLRRRVRAAIRRLVESIWVLVVPRGHHRLCAVQLWFRGSKMHRDYLVLMKRGGQWWARSLATVAGGGDLDLRKRMDAAKLETVLSATDVG